MRARPNYQYQIYPSLLDAYQEYLDTNPETFFFQDEQGAWHKNYNENTGEFHLSDEEVDTLARQRLLDCINRVGFTSEAADKGSCFNEILDCIITGVKSTRDDISIRTKDYIVTQVADGLVDPSTGKVLGGDVRTNEKYCPHIEAEMDGFIFRYDIDFCKQAANYFKGSVCQMFTCAPIETGYGNVFLYGYVDYIRENKVYDAKTTKRYEFGQYKKKWQKTVYPYCLIKSGKVTEIQDFEYTCFKWKSGEPLRADMYTEVYTYDHKKSTESLRQMCERFIEFLIANKSAITDKKVFGGKNH